MNCMVYKMETRIPRDTTNDCISLIYVYYTFYICMYIYRYSNMIGCTWNTIFQKKNAIHRWYRLDGSGFWQYNGAGAGTCRLLRAC